MTLQEVNSRLNKAITEEQFNIVHPLSVMLDLDKDEFCCIIDAIGITKFVVREPLIRRLGKASRAYSKYEEYEEAKCELERINRAAQRYREIVENYRPLT